MADTDLAVCDPLFKGCTRPAMFFGIPIVPLMIVVGVVMLVSVWTTFFLLLTLVALLPTMRIIAKQDDQQFHMLGLKMVFRLINRNKNGKFWGASTYSPFIFTKR